MGVARRKFVDVTNAFAPIALAEPLFPLRALAVAAARAPLGGARESLMATLVCARLAAAAIGADALPESLRAKRAAAARHWIGALSLPAALRATLGRMLDASVRGEGPALASALTEATETTAAHLDRKARAELDRLARRLAG